MMVAARACARYVAAACLSSGCAAVPVSVGAAASDAGALAADAAPGANDGGAEAATALYLEAEQGLLGGGFTVIADADASAGEALAPPADTDADDAPAAARARYGFTLAAGSYVVWGRIRAPGAGQNRFWFSVDGAPFRKWRISVGDIWYWDDLHDDADYGHALRFELGSGAHTLELAAAVPGVALDRLYVTSLGDTPPGNDTPCSPPHSIELLGTCHASCGAQSGRACGEAACAGRTIIEAYDCGVCCLVP